MSEISQGRIFGYARVSSTEQNLDRQLAELVKYVTEEKIVTDKQSGKDLERGGYQALKGRFGLRRGDTLYIMSLDRLSRNKADIKAELQWFKDNGIRLMILDLPSSMIQGFNRQLRKVTKSRTVFPSDDSLLKMLYLVTMDITKKWTGRRRDWSQIRAQLEIYFEEWLEKAEF